MSIQSAAGETWEVTQKRVGNPSSLKQTAYISETSVCKLTTKSPQIPSSFKNRTGCIKSSLKLVINTITRKRLWQPKSSATSSYLPYREMKKSIWMDATWKLVWHIIKKTSNTVSIHYKKHEISDTLVLKAITNPFPEDCPSFKAQHSVKQSQAEYGKATEQMKCYQKPEEAVGTNAGIH